MTDRPEDTSAIRQLADAYIAADAANAMRPSKVARSSKGRSSKNRSPVVPPPRFPLSLRTAGILGGLLAIIVLLVGGSTLLSSQPAGAKGTSAPSGPGGTFSSPLESPAGSQGLSVPGFSVSPTSPPATASPTKAPSKATAAPTPTLKPAATPTAPPVIVAFSVNPQQVAGSCKSGLSAFELKLDNTGSNVPVAWSVSFATSPYPGDWGSAKPASGQVSAGQSSTLTITPAGLCSYIKGPTDFNLNVAFGKAGSTAVTYAVTP